LHQYFGGNSVNTHEIVICGDMNGSAHRDKTSHDPLFKKFLLENRIGLNLNYPEKDTFYHHNGKSSGQIDYRITGRCLGGFWCIGSSYQFSFYLSYHYRQSTTRKPTGKSIWNNNIAEATKNAKIKYNQWRNAGKPKGRENPLKSQLMVFGV
jgi:hypothetical protein